MQHRNDLNGSETLVRQVRSRFTEGGSSLRAWCIANAVSPSYAHRVLAGKKNGPAAAELRQVIIRESEVAA